MRETQTSHQSQRQKPSVGRPTLKELRQTPKRGNLKREKPNAKRPTPKSQHQKPNAKARHSARNKNYKLIDAQNIVTFRALPCEYQADQAREPSLMNKQQEAA